MLIVLAMLDKVFKGSRMVYTCTLLFTGIVSVVDALSQAGFNIEFLVNNFAKLPLYSQGLGWIVPAVAGILLGLVLCIIKKDRLQSKNIFTEEV